MSDSDSDVPLVKSKANGTNGTKPKSADRIPASVDKAMDKQGPSNRAAHAGVSLRNGPVEEMDVDEPATNGATNGKRKARTSAGNRKSYKDASSAEEESESDKPLSKRRKVTKKAVESSSSEFSEEDDVPLVHHMKKPPKVTKEQIGMSDSDDTPVVEKLSKQKKDIEKAAAKEAKAIRANEKKPTAKRKSTMKKEDTESDDDVPLVKKSKATASKKTNGVKKEESDDDVPLVKASAAKKSKAKADAAPAKEGKGKAAVKTQEDLDAEEEEEQYKWWEDTAKGDGTKKWSTLSHNGVLFAPEYEPLPKNVRMRYDGKPVEMSLEAEEVAGFYGTMLNSEVNVSNPTFNKNFFEDFQEVLKKTGGAKDKQGNPVKIKDFEKCDFKPIFEYYDAERTKKKALSAAEKKAIKAAKDEAEAPYQYCMWDGRKQKVGNFRVEPPGLFRGRGEHPKTGRVKKRVMPEQVTINIGKEAQVPAPPEGHKWKEVKHDQEGTWLAMWQENVNGNYKYVMLAANSDVKGQSDYKKFEKARELKKHIDRIRKDYTTDLKSKVMADRQRATAVYLIDKFALRAGNEKGEDEADTVGCCSLKFEHVTLSPPDKVIFDFLGKDSIRFYDEVTVDVQVFKNLKLFKQPPKKDGDEIFDRLTTTALNKHLSSYMQGLTAKVFRTYNASYTMATLLKDLKQKPTTAEMLQEYNAANRRVAILCNHKRTVGAAHGAQMEKLDEKIKGMRYEQWRVKQMMLDIDPKLKKKRGAEYFERDEDLTNDWVEKHQVSLVEEMRDKIRKKFAKDNEKLAAEGEKEMKQKELDERLEAADEVEKKFKKENKTGKVEAEGKGPTIEKLETKLDNLQKRIENAKIQAAEKEDNKEVALGTSKINYIDPRLSVVFSKKFNVPIERLFSKTLRDKFTWAIESVDEDWEF